MYKKTSNQTHFLPRRGSFSTHPQRNGRVDVLPPDAKMHLYDVALQIADGERRIESLRHDREEKQNRVHSLRGVDRLRGKMGSPGSESSQINKLLEECGRIDNEIKRSRSHINQLKRFVSGRKDMSYGDVFMRLAELELPHDIYEALSQRAHQIMDRVRGSQ